MKAVTLIVRLLAALLLLTAILPVRSIAQKPGRLEPSSNEPFSSFQVIDQQLSLINARADQLAKGRLAPAARSRAVADIRIAISRIEQLSTKLEAHYHTRQEGFGVKMFAELKSAALLVGRSVRAVTSAKSDRESKAALDQLSHKTLDLVVAFQKVSANYGAVHCQRGAWACCQPRGDSETNAGPANACKWSCVANRQTCRGFLGPQTRRF
jgi:hypothetical protein